MAGQNTTDPVQNSPLQRGKIVFDRMERGYRVKRNCKQGEKAEERQGTGLPFPGPDNGAGRLSNVPAVTLHAPILDGPAIGSSFYAAFYNRWENNRSVS